MNSQDQDFKSPWFISGELSAAERRERFEYCLSLIRATLLNHVRSSGWIRSMEDAEDLVQEVIAKAWSKRKQFRGGYLLTWLRKITFNIIVDKSRKGTLSMTDTDSYVSIPDKRPDPHSAEYFRDRWLVLRICADLLPAQQRRIFLRWFEIYAAGSDTGESFQKEIAREMNISQRAVHDGLWRAAAKLAVCIKNKAMHGLPDDIKSYAEFL